MRTPKHTWPENCIWPEPLMPGDGDDFDPEDIEGEALDETCEELFEIKEYFDNLVEQGILNEDYSLNEDYQPDEDPKTKHKETKENNPDEGTKEHPEEDPDEYNPYNFTPETGEDYWDNGFDYETWREDLLNHYNLLKLPTEPDTPTTEIRDITGYEFINENLLRQAFTRRAFAADHNLSGCCEELEFLGDTVLNTVVTREIIRHLAETDETQTDAPFQTSKYNEGDLTKLRAHYISKEYLAERARQFNLGQYILYGKGEEETDSSLEDATEALIGAIAIDSNWNWYELENTIDRLLCIQLTNPDRFLKKTHYELFNAWHQKRFGAFPDYEVSKGTQNPPHYYCTLRYRVPENNLNIPEYQRTDEVGTSRSEARERAAFNAYHFVRSKGLWMNLKDANITPNPENAINQLQELYQKKYADAPAQYDFEEFPDNHWSCNCVFAGIHGYGSAPTKTKAKKKASYMVLIRLLDSAGICQREWKRHMYSYCLSD